MPVYHLSSQADQSNIALIKKHASVTGWVYSVRSSPAHTCDAITKENIAVIVYTRQFQGAVKDIIKDLFAQYGPSYYGMSEETCEEELIHIKMHSCICDFSTF